MMVVALHDNARDMTRINKESHAVGYNHGVG